MRTTVDERVGEGASQPLEETRSGVDVLRTLRAYPQTVGTPIVVCSADVSFLRDHEDELRSLGCGTLAKPFDLTDLIALVARPLDPEMMTGT